ncbi:hypothetical protein SAMN05444724_3303 [Salinivibrio sp. ES.052]|nr:hypothetical protein SAMN05444724_3303 [Salinivibrio sp. ES.052]
MEKLRTSGVLVLDFTLIYPVSEIVSRVTETVGVTYGQPWHKQSHLDW